MPYINPEQSARQQIDVRLAASGWLIEEYKEFNPLAAGVDHHFTKPVEPERLIELLRSEMKGDTS